MKRSFDLVVAVVILLLLIPILAVLACAVYLDDPGPVIYRGLRVGRGEKLFYIWKFRTMKIVPQSKREITVKNDPRVTRIGRLLRVSKLDELPQIINVLIGEMSFVGPRPESPHYLPYYTPEQKLVLRARPGITGQTQIRFRHEEQWLDGPDPEKLYIERILPAKLALDLDYVQHRSFLGDMNIIFRTVLAVARPRSQPLFPLEKPVLAEQHQRELAHGR
jgi:lipopolysaccharide/colanic/teichoic acid biosynthesis glycosyltransferase